MPKKENMKIVCIYPKSEDAKLNLLLRHRLLVPLVRHLNARIVEIKRAGQTDTRLVKEVLDEKPDAAFFTWWGEKPPAWQWGDSQRIREAGIPLAAQCMDRLWRNVSLRWRMAFEADCYAEDTSPMEALWPYEMAHTRLGLFTAGAGEPHELKGSSHIYTASAADTPLGIDWAGIFEALGAGNLCIVERTGLTGRILPAEAVAFFSDREERDMILRRACADPDWATSTARQGQEFYQAQDREIFWQRAMEMLVKQDSGIHALPIFQPELIHEEGRLNEPLYELITKAGIKAISVPSVPIPSDGRIWCHHPWYGLEYDINGDYGPCCFIRYPGNGDVPDSVEAMNAHWNSKEMQRLRHNMIRGDVGGTPCETCSIRYLESRDSLWGLSTRIPKVSTHQSENFNQLHQRVQNSYEQGQCRLDVPPLSLYALGSPRCNLRCIMCMQDHEKKEFFPVERLKKLVLEMGWNTLDRFGFVGGEIFINKDCLELLDFAIKSQPSGTCIVLITNAVAVNRYLDDIGRIKNVLYIQSIDGYQSHYEMIRKGGSWQGVTQNLEQVVELAKNRADWKIYINSLVMVESLSCIKDMVNFIDAMGLNLFFMPIVGGHENQDFFTHPELLPDPKFAFDQLQTGVQLARIKKADRAEHSLKAIIMNWATKWRFRFVTQNRLIGLARTTPKAFVQALAKCLFPLGPMVQPEPLRATVAALRDSFSPEIMEHFFLAVEGGVKSQALVRNELAAYFMDEAELEKAVEYIQAAERLDPASALCAQNRERYQRELSGR